MEECSNCGLNLPDTYDSDICVSCGESLLEEDELQDCPSCEYTVREEWEICPSCGEPLVEEDELLMDVDNAKVLERPCGCGETFHILYQEKEASLNLDLIASKLGLGGSYNTIEPKVIGTHSVTCPLCGSELTIAQMAKMKIAAMLFGDPFSSDEAPPRA